MSTDWTPPVDPSVPPMPAAPATATPPASSQAVNQAPVPPAPTAAEPLLSAATPLTAIAATPAQLVPSLEAVPGTILAWATRPGSKTLEGLASIIAVPASALVAFLVSFLVSWNLINSAQAVEVITGASTVGVPLIVGWVTKGLTEARSAVKAEAIRLHLPVPPGL